MSAPTPIAFKVELKRRDQPSSFHRFSGHYSFSELSTVISHLWGERPKNLVLCYVDDEDDAIRISHQVEWEECVRIFQEGKSSAKVLRLTGMRLQDTKKDSRNKGGNKKDEECSATSSSSDDSEAEAEIPAAAVPADLEIVEDLHLRASKKNLTPPPATLPGMTAVPAQAHPLSSRLVQEEKAKPFNMDSLYDSVAADLAEAATADIAPAPTTKVAAHVAEAEAEHDEDHSAYGDDVEHFEYEGSDDYADTYDDAPAVVVLEEKKEQLVAPPSPKKEETPEPEVKKTQEKSQEKVTAPKAAISELDTEAESMLVGLMLLVNPDATHSIGAADVDKEQLYKNVISKSNKLVKAKSLPQAEQLLRTAMTVFSNFTSWSRVEYNLACVLSLQNKNLDEAIDTLLIAKRKGYDDMWKHQFKTDADLRNVRNHPRFHAEVVPTAAAHVHGPTGQKPIGAGHTAEVCGTTGVDPRLQILAIFPYMTINEAGDALIRANGNLERAINKIMEGGR